MISIFNKKLDTLIKIGNVDWITFMPREYEDKPNVIIEFGNGFHFARHAQKCEDCGLFLKAFGSKTLDWYITYNEKIHRLDLSTLGSKDYYDNEIKFTSSTYNYGTRMKLIIHPMTTDDGDIQSFLKRAIADEDYETACLIRDLEKPV
jgi:hypothetical protein